MSANKNPTAFMRGSVNYKQLLLTSFVFILLLSLLLFLFLPSHHYIYEESNGTTVYNEGYDINDINKLIKDYNLTGLTSIHFVQDIPKELNIKVTGTYIYYFNRKEIWMETLNIYSFTHEYCHLILDTKINKSILKEYKKLYKNTTSFITQYANYSNDYQEDLCENYKFYINNETWNLQPDRVDFFNKYKEVFRK